MGPAPGDDVIATSTLSDQRNKETALSDLPTRLARVVARHFDPAHLNPDALVVIPEVDEIMELLGWDQEVKAWRLKSVSSGECFSKEIADAYMVRRVMWHVAGRPGAMFNWETAPQFQDLVAQMAEEFLREEAAA